MRRRISLYVEITIFNLVAMLLGVFAFGVIAFGVIVAWRW
jgi:hypothetical protein